MEQDRKQEILKAEETIRQLAAEMARVSRTAAEVDIVKSKLENAHIALEQAKAALDSAASAISRTEASSSKAIAKASEASAAALAEARGNLEQVAIALPNSLQDFSNKITLALEARTVQLRRLVLLSVVLSAAATIIGVAVLVVCRIP